MNIPKKPGIHFQEVVNSKRHNALSMHNECAKSTGSGWGDRMYSGKSEKNFIKIQIKWGGKCK